MLRGLATTAALALTLVGAVAGRAFAAESGDARAVTATVAQSTEETKAAPGGIAYRGFLTNRYRARFSGGAQDHDYYGLLGFDIGDSWRDRVTGHFLGRVTIDIDGNQHSSNYFVFTNVVDEKSDAIDGRVYDAHVDVHRLGPLSRLRLGRQSDYTTPELAYFDGVSFETERWSRWRFKLAGYGGLPVRFFDTSLDGDVVGGVYARLRPWRGARLRADWMHVKDDFYGASQSDLTAFAAWQRIGEGLSLHGRYTLLGDENRDVLARVTYRYAPWDLLVQGSYFALLSTENRLELELDRFSESLFERIPFHEMRLLASKGFGKHLVIDGGYERRWLNDDSRRSAYNREFDRLHATATVLDCLKKGLSASVTGEYWKSDEPNLTNREIVSTAAELAYASGRDLRLAVGTYYSLFKYDIEKNRERDQVQTYYVRARYRVWKQVRLDLRYEFEDAEFGDFHELDLRVTVDFRGRT